MRTILQLILMGCFGLSLSACGGPPPIAEIESSLNSPSATLNGDIIKASFLDYTKGQLAVKMPGLSKYGKMVSFLTVNDPNAKSAVPMKRYLVQSGIPTKMTELLAPYLPLNNDLSLRKSMFKNKSKFGVIRQALPVSFKADCVQSFLGLNLMGKGGTFRYIIDLACQGVGSGQIELKAKAVSNGDDAKLRFEIRFFNACNKGNHCVNGSLIYKFEGSSSEAGASGRMLVSMRLQVSVGSGKSVDIKQGMRISFNTAQRAGKLEIVVYAKDSKGREGTVVLGLQASGDQSSFSARGSNGSVVCKTSDRGQTGKCFADAAQGSVKYSW